MIRPVEEGGTYVDGRYVCTAAQPYDPKRHGTHALHSQARCVGQSSDGACDDYECPHCGMTWRTCYDDD